MRTLHSISTVGAEQFSPARKRWENSYGNLRSAVGAALTHELFHLFLPIPRTGRLRIGISLSSLSLSWSTN